MSGENSRDASPSSAVDGDVAIRPYRAEDRAGVRHVCYTTGYLGDRVDWLWRDRESFADLFSGWWTDHEPESATVAELDGEVAGYLLGCVDSSRVELPARLLLHHMVSRRLLVSPGTAGVLCRMIGDVVVDGARRRLPIPVSDPRWPAHLHIDLLPELRGRGVGAALVQGWLARLRAAEVPGCHLETFAENAGAIAFFEVMGFERRGTPKPAPGFRTPGGGRHHVQLMVQDLT